MELSLRLDTLGMVDVRYLRRREQYRDWPQFQLMAASRQAKITAYMSREVADQLHQQILQVEEAVGLNIDDDDGEDGEEDELEEAGEHSDQSRDELEADKEAKPAERDTSAFSPAFAQALKQLNELARQRLPDASSNAGASSGELSAETELVDDEEDAIELLQDAFVQMMEVVRELAEEMSTDALKLTGRLKCARTNIEFVPQAIEEDEEENAVLLNENGKQVEAVMELQVELVMILQLFEEGRSRPDDVPAIELQLDVDDFERLHETLDLALDSEQRGRRRRQF